MTAKGLDRPAFFVGLALALTAGTAEAQLVNGQWRVFTPQPAARVGVQVSAPTVFAQQVMNPIFLPRQPVAFTYVPTIVMSDGSVYGNYGYGYQQVVPCGPAATPYAQYGLTVNGSGVVYGATTTQSQPLPNQQTRSQQMVASQPMVTTSAQYGGPTVQSPCAQQVTPAPAPAVGRRY